jgi:uncharacterized protein YcnI
MKKLLLPALLALVAMPALAHVTANPNEGKAGNYFQTSFRITHGCDGHATKAVRIKIPEGVLSVHPQFKPGWKVKITKVKLPHPVTTGHGKTVDEAVSAVTWSGARLPDDQYDEFGLVMKLPERADETLWFPVTQICEGATSDWAEIPTEGQEWHSLQRPAPFVKLTP